MADKKIYCGSGKQQTKTWFKATVKSKILMEYLQEYKGAEFTKIDINLLDKPDKFGKDVEITIDTWKPTKKKEDFDYKENIIGKDRKLDPDNNDDLPF